MLHYKLLRLTFLLILQLQRLLLHLLLHLKMLQAFLLAYLLQVLMNKQVLLNHYCIPYLIIL